MDLKSLSGSTNARDQAYQEFVAFVRADVQSERRLASRRMFNVFIWCFLLPAVVSAILIFSVRLGFLPVGVARYVDWVLVLFPIAYSCYILSFEVLSEIPGAFRQGALSTSLGNALKEAEWRKRVCEGLEKQTGWSTAEWEWIVACFKVDLANIQSRTRYVTALSGAVIFLIIQGLDALDGLPLDPFGSKAAFLNWLETSSDHIYQFLGLGLFLVLLYISGSQTYQSLNRYLHCAELMLLTRKERD